jgi:endogenous inhibitor of DNA gyrase (YacG/DUF329 family)
MREPERAPPPDARAGFTAAREFGYAWFMPSRSDAVWIPTPPQNECPHCTRTVSWEGVHAWAWGNGLVNVKIARCPACGRDVVDYGRHKDGAWQWHAAWPHRRVRFQVPPEVPAEVARDFRDATAVASISLRAAAALARRALQVALREAGFKAKRLKDEIDLATQSPDSPTSLRDKLHVVREIGNDAAHPNEDPEGAIVDVSEVDVEFLFETLLETFDVFFIRPAKHKRLMEARKTPKPNA